MRLLFRSIIRHDRTQRCEADTRITAANGGRGRSRGFFIRFRLIFQQPTEVHTHRAQLVISADEQKIRSNKSDDVLNICLNLQT